MASRYHTFLDSLNSLRDRCRQRRAPLSLMVLDLDCFWERDEVSSEFVAQVRERFASILADIRRASDLCSCDESRRFLIALPDTHASEARWLAERCHRRVHEMPLVQEGRRHDVTVSIGLAESTTGFVESEQQLIRRARIALDHAQHLGGGRIVTWTELIDTHLEQAALPQSTARNVSRWMDRIHRQLQDTYVESTRALVAAVEAKDPYTRAHSVTVAAYAEEICKRMRLSDSVIEAIRAAGLLHDVGKIGVPDAILTKPGPLTDDEFDVVKRHPQTALDILGHVHFLADARPMILHHHERFDGSGYPYGLAGNDIPIGARVLSMADALDTMFSPRSYKPPYDAQRVQKEVAAGSGRQFDPAVAATTLAWLHDVPADFPDHAMGAV